MEFLAENPRHPSGVNILKKVFEFFENNKTHPAKHIVHDIIVNSEFWKNYQQNLDLQKRLNALREFQRQRLEDIEFERRYPMPNVPTELERQIAQLEHKYEIINMGWKIIASNAWFKRLPEHDQQHIIDCFTNCNPKNELDQLRQRHQSGKGRGPAGPSVFF